MGAFIRKVSPRVCARYLVGQVAPLPLPAICGRNELIRRAAVAGRPYGCPLVCYLKIDLKLGNPLPANRWFRFYLLRSPHNVCPEKMWMAGWQQNIAVVIYIHLWPPLRRGSGRRQVIHSAGHPSIHPSICAMQQVMQRSSLTRTMKPLSVLRHPPLAHTPPPLHRPPPRPAMASIKLSTSCMHLALQTIFAVVVFTQQTTPGSGRNRSLAPALSAGYLGILFFTFQPPPPPPPRPRHQPIQAISLPSHFPSLTEQTNMLCLKRTY